MVYFRWSLVVPLFLFAHIREYDAVPKKTKWLRKRFKGEGIKEKECDIYQSSTARRVLAQGFHSVFEANDQPIPWSCPFNTSRDLFYEFELIKNYQTTARWKCEACGKAFYTEHHLDSHFIRKHNDVIIKTKDSVCLADYCDILRCDLHKSYPDIPEKIKCNDKTALTLQRSCEKLLRGCLPNSADAHKIYDKTVDTFCSSLTCEKFLAPFQDSLSIWTVVVISMAVPGLVIVLGSLCFYFLDLLENDDIQPVGYRRLSDHALYENTYEHVVKQRGSRIRQRTLIHGDPYSSDLSRGSKRWDNRHAYYPMETLGRKWSLLEPIDPEPGVSQRDWLAIDMA